MNTSMIQNFTQALGHLVIRIPGIKLSFWIILYISHLMPSPQLP